METTIVREYSPEVAGQLVMSVQETTPAMPDTQFETDLSQEPEQQIGRIAVCRTCPVTDADCGTAGICNALGCQAGNSSGGRRRLL